MSVNSGRLYARLLGGAAFVALSAGAAWAEPANFNIAPQPLALAVGAFSEQSGRPVLLKPELADKLATKGVSGSLEPELALAEMLSGTGLTYRKTGDTFLIESASDPQSGSAAGDGAGTVEALIVTAQKKEEAIQDVPIAISAFTEKSLEEQKIEGGFDLLKAIPNVTFSKNNFSSYNFSIRGIGTKAVSATTDPGVAVSFNNIALIQNRLFEQEYFDVERVEVLRGPQGTLYGRNATAGVINVISAKPDMREFKGWVKGEVGNYHAKRLSAMVNIPLVQDKLAIRVAGSLTDRAGYDFNSGTKHAVNGRDLWSGRITVAFNPTDNIRSNLVWERFNEDDNRSRTGKQLCHRDPGPETIAGFNVIDAQYNDKNWQILGPALFSTGCKPGSLYDPAAFGTPNGLALPFVFGMLALGAPCKDMPEGISCIKWFPGYTNPLDDRTGKTLIDMKDPYGGLTQTRDLRVIDSFNDPIYRAKADVIEFNLDVEVLPNLSFSSQTAYNRDSVYSFQDYNRFNTVPIFNNTSDFLTDYIHFDDQGNLIHNIAPAQEADLAPGGVFCDPQLGCSRSLAGFDISKANGQQFTQEIRLQSNFDAPVNFSLGANYTRFSTLVDYYVLYNLITAFAEMPLFNDDNDITKCTHYTGAAEGYVSVDINSPESDCPYVDPNPLASINGEGHNYFRSKNPYKLKSAAVFGELYWQVRDNFKVTAGLRYTDDRKSFTPVPSQVLLIPGISATGGGTVTKGYPEDPPIKQHWGEFTGRLGVDWKPALSFTDQTMIYAFYSRGYKGGGANPPTIGFDKRTIAEVFGLPSGINPRFDKPFAYLPGVEYGPTFKPEFVNAFEVGTKNTLLGGALVFNNDVFFYDYTDYQVSQIRDRTAVNENFDAKVWGLEFETVWHPSRNLRINANLGYLDTSIGKGMKSIDITNRTQGNPDWVVVKPWLTMPSNCIVPAEVAKAFLASRGSFGSAGGTGWWVMCGGFGISPNGLIDPNTGAAYTPDAYPEIHGGAGFTQDLSGNELPNSPHWTSNIGVQYSYDFLDSWKATVRADGYWQSQSWARVYNAVNDKLHGWYNANLSLWLENDDGLKIELYAKNILDKTPITDAFINSDDTALTTNVFVLDPRLIGLSIKKDF